MRAHRLSTRALGFGVLTAALAVARAEATPARDALADREATRAALLASEHDGRWAAETGRRKPDTIGAVDFERLLIQTTLPAEGLPDSATFEITLRPTDAFGGVFSLLAIDWRPLAVTDLDTGESLLFEDAPDAAEVLIRLERRVERGERVRLRVDAALEIPCGDPVHCQVRDTPRHLVQFGWYPANFDAPLEDRFALALLVDAPGTGLCTTGEPTDGPNRPPSGRTIAAWPSTLPGLVWGPLETQIARARPILWTCTTAGDAVAAERMVSVAGAVLDHHAELLGPLPVDRLTLAQVVNGTGAALSPMQLILLPRYVWTRNGEEEDALRDALLSHEVTHQYFFDAVGITTPADAWISEGIAEYAACRFQEARQGDDAAFRLNYWGYVLGVPSEPDAPVASETAPQSRDAFEILYQKASVIWRRLEAQVGRAGVDQLLQTLATRFAGAILSTPELLDTVVELHGETPRRWLADQLERVDVTLLEARTAHGRGRNDPARLTLSLRPRRGPAEPTPIFLHSEDGPPTVLTVLPDNEAAPLEVPATVKWLTVDPELQTFRRVEPQPATDVNLSGVVDGMDLLDVLAADGRRVPGADWDDRLDTNADERIDTLDAEAIADAFGEGW